MAKKTRNEGRQEGQVKEKKEGKLERKEKKLSENIAELQKRMQEEMEHVGLIGVPKAADVPKPGAGKQRVIARVPTGIPGFDSLVAGGFERNGIVLVGGDSGTGKTIFCM